MPNTVRRIEIIPQKVKRTIFKQLKQIAFKHDGIIFGGMVRDEIISTHYEKIFYKNLEERYNWRKYWDESFHPESAARTIVPEDMDVSFPSQMQADNFINEVIQTMQQSAGENIAYNVEEKIAESPYGGIGLLRSVRNITFTLYLGSIPFVFRGYELQISIDVVLPRASSIQPPFKNLDMLCNSFIMSKQGIVLSNATGLCLDSLTAVERAKVSSKIMEDMVQFKTEFTLCSRFLGESGSFRLNKYAFKRIEKMLEKRFKWNIENLPFVVSKMQADDKQTECCICYSHFKKNRDTKISFFLEKDEKKIQGAILHQHCLFEYIHRQIEDSERTIVDENDDFKFKCPFRNPFDFIKCSRTITDKINSMIQ